jgi:alpha-amylase/alpha-mannosidase (GH57 family)
MEGSVVHMRNNYESINFDIGPTLALWLSNHGKPAYRAMTRGDALSREGLAGHGNAIAQSYNHSILPLLSARDRDLQIAWGIEDFEYRFGRRPLGMWLPECAVDGDTLASIAAAGLKFIILGPQQGQYRGDDADTRAAGPFLWSNGTSEIAIFRFDREMSATISFGEGLHDGGRLAEWMVATALALPERSVLMFATDGETFGHHKKNGAAELARALIQLQRRDDVVVTNCEQYLAQHGARGHFLIDGPSSWSCVHGVERWRSECGCRLEAGTRQEWRGPLRTAMEFVSNHVEAVYDRFAPALVKDPKGAIRASIRLMIDANPSVQEKWFSRFGVNGELSRERLLRLFEMVRAGQSALTSCAWFFDDFGGPEGRVALKWAARAVELAAEHTPSIEGELLPRLREIRSNRHEIGDAATLYLSLKTREARGRV